jgi:hypothetical protein
MTHEPGDWVEVTAMESIKETLSETARNRGLYFSPGMRLLYGERHRVRRRIGKISVDGAGEMRQLRTTVYLDASLRGGAKPHLLARVRSRSNIEASP